MRRDASRATAVWIGSNPAPHAFYPWQRPGVVYNRRVANAMWPLAASLCSLVVLTAPSVARDTRQASQSSLVTIDSLDSSHASCTVVKFAVRNVSSRSVYVNVYVENREAGAWTPVPCQQEDARSSSPVTQRIRVEAYWHEQAQADAVVFSKPFARVPSH